jgi:predicted nuclease of predicted toxin-antitoxin system
VSCRIFLDENLSPAIAETLRRLGHDSLSAHEVGMLGVLDDALLGFAAEQGRVFISSDYGDFARLSIEWNEAGRDFPGIVLVKQVSAEISPGEIVARIEQHITPDPARLQNSLTWLPPLQ